MEHNKKSRAMNAIILIIALTILSKIIGFVRDALIGSSFGTGTESDAYFMGITITTTIFLSLGSGIATTIIPISMKLQKDDSQEKNRAYSGIINWVLLISAVITVLCFMFTPELLEVFAKSFSGDKLQLTGLLTKIMIPTVFFICLAYLFVGILQAHEQYMLPAIISFPYNIIAIVFLFIGVKQYGIVGLSVITTIGWLLQMLMQVPRVWKVTGFSYSAGLFYENKYVKDFLVGIITISLISATQQLAFLSDNAIATYFGEGKVSALYYSNMLFLAIVTTAVYGITAVMFPKFNKKFVDLDKTAFYKSIDSVIQGILLFMVPVSAGLAIVSKNAISIILMRGEFDIKAVEVTAVLLAGYASYMVAFGIWDVLNKAYYTMGNKRIPMLISVLIIITNIVLNIVLTKPLGLVGIPLATSISFYLGVIVSMFLFRYSEGLLDIKGFCVTFIKTITSAALMAAAIYGINSVLALDSEGIIAKIIILAIDMGLGILVYFITLLLLKEKNIMEIIQNIKNKNKGRAI